MKKTVKYLVKLDGISKLSTKISPIEDYPSISKIEYDYDSRDHSVMIRVHSDLNINDVEKFLATVTNHAVPDYSKANVQVINDSLLSRLMVFKPKMLDMEINDYGLISRLRYSPQRSAVG